MEESVPGPSLATVSTERDPENVVDTGASRAARRSLRPRARRITGSRLWPSTVTGRRSYRNTLALLRDIANRMEFERLPLIVTDGFDFYEKVVRRVFGPAVLYGQVLKMRTCWVRCDRRASAFALRCGVTVESERSTRGAARDAGASSRTPTANRRRPRRRLS